MKINELFDNVGRGRKRKRVGRGPGSGHGKTSCRGQKGQKSRKGSSFRMGFEGGQFPLYRRVPKRGFVGQYSSDEYAVVNLYQLNAFDNGEVVNYESLLSKGLVKKNKPYVKLLGSGELSKRLTIHVHAISESAKNKVELAKGTLVIEPLKTANKEVK